MTTSNDNDNNNDNNNGREGRSSWPSMLREFRHNPCLMTPITAIMLVIFGLFILLTLLFQAPTLVLGLFLSPILQRGGWYIEFLYPWGIARWGHFLLIQGAARRRQRDEDKNRGFHSRATEQRIEVVPGKVFIHPIPQFVDNIGYLIVCLPPNNDQQKRNQKKKAKTPIVAIMIDCGDAQATLRAVELIQEYHYPNKSIQIQSIASTHKHHDHTGGNKNLLDQVPTIEHIYGGAVERVPYCTILLSDGDKLDLPKVDGNDMRRLVQIEAVSVPAHTRGSIVYLLRPNKPGPKTAEFMFTGDTMFCGGGGVPFEADSGLPETERQLSRCNGNTFIRTLTGGPATERCFAEILSRAFPSVLPNCNATNFKSKSEDISDRVLVFPGHEYTLDLITRQFQAMEADSCKWKNFPPAAFFGTLSEMFVAMHRRSLPHNSGRLLAVPSTIRRELWISPHFRSLKRSGELVVRAIIFWHTHFCKNKLKLDGATDSMQNREANNNTTGPTRGKTPSKVTQWNIDASDISRETFTTVYTVDLEKIIEDLDSGKIKKRDAIDRLKNMKNRLEEPVISRRPIPGKLPSDKTIYKGVAGLALVGSRPSAMTVSDSRTMKIPAPIDTNSDRIKISKKRLIVVLDRLGLLKAEEQGEFIVAMIVQLWKEAKEYLDLVNGTKVRTKILGDIESIGDDDELELGLLKWMLYGIPANQPSWFSKFCCMPCASDSYTSEELNNLPEHPAKDMKQKAGDLVAHDVITCPLCRDATGRCKLGHNNNNDNNTSEHAPPATLKKPTETPLEDGSVEVQKAKSTDTDK